jgi:DnaJ-class molecular chaperone
VTVDVVVPTSLSDDEKRAIEQLAALSSDDPREKLKRNRK